jgi:UDP-N-acetylmuramate: L-alanyl-gamma-D-glutamyl-meso-diaminopimelate ligase
LQRFKGIRRRLERVGDVAGVTVYDDFAHHPTAIDETVRALRSQVGHARIVAVIEPRSNTMKLGVMKARLPAALEGADVTFCLGGDALGWDAAEALGPLGARARVASTVSGSAGWACRGVARRRSRAGDEQRRFWRNSPGLADPLARATDGSTHGIAS